MPGQGWGRGKGIFIQRASGEAFRPSEQGELPMMHDMRSTSAKDYTLLNGAPAISVGLTAFFLQTLPFEYSIIG